VVATICLARPSIAGAADDDIPFAASRSVDHEHRARDTQAHGIERRAASSRARFE